MKRLLKLGLLFSLALIAGAASASTLYVTTAGNDSNPCTLAQPCLTPTHAEAVAAPGDIVSVAPGVYSYGGSAATFSNAGSSGNPITVTCSTRGACQITNTVTGNSTVVYIHAQYINFDGFEVTNTGAGNNLGIYVDVSNVSLTRNNIHHIQTDCTSTGGGGIQIAVLNLTNILIDSNIVHDISWVSGNPKCNSTVVQTDGILAEQTGFSTTTTISNNIVYNTSGGWGILASTNAKIVFNTVFNTVNGGIALNNAPSGAIVQDNIVVYTGLLAHDGAFYGGTCGIQNGSSSSTTYGYNQLSNNHGGNYGTGFGCSGSGTTTGDITTDPASGTTFVNWQQNGSGNYHLKSGAPAINAGLNNGITTDYDGNIRPFNGGYDIGAYELQPLNSIYIQVQSNDGHLISNNGNPMTLLNGSEYYAYAQMVLEQVSLSSATAVYDGSNFTTLTFTGTTSAQAGAAIKFFNVTGFDDLTCKVISSTTHTVVIQPFTCNYQPTWMTTTGGGATLNVGAFYQITDTPNGDTTGTVEIINTSSDTTAKYFIQNSPKTAGSSASGSCSTADKYDLHTAACYETHPSMKVNEIGWWFQIYLGNTNPTCTQTGSIQFGNLSLTSTLEFDVKFTSTADPTKTGTQHFLVCADGAGSGKHAILTSHPGYRQSFAGEQHLMVDRVFANANQYVRPRTITPDSPGSGNATLEEFPAPAGDGFIQNSGSVKPLYVIHANSRTNIGYTIHACADADPTACYDSRFFVPDPGAAGGAKPAANPSLVKQTPCAVDPVMTAAGGGTLTVGGGTRTYQHLYDINTNALTWGSIIQIFNDGGAGTPTTFNEYWEIFPPTNYASFATNTVVPAVFICGVANPTTGEMPVQDGAGAVARSNVGNFTGVGNLLTINGIVSTPSPDNYTGHIQAVHGVTVAGIKFLHDNANPAYFHYAPGDTTRSGSTFPYSNGESVRPFAVDMFSGYGTYSSEVANPLFSDCNGDGGWQRNCTDGSWWEGNHMVLYGNTNSFTEHPFYVQDLWAVVIGNMMGGSVHNSGGTAYGSFRTARGLYLFNRGVPESTYETASLISGSSTVQDAQKYYDPQNVWGPTPTWGGGSSCSNGSYDYPLCGSSGQMFGGMATEAAMQTEHFHGWFVGGNVFKMIQGICSLGIPDANSGNFLADQHTLFAWNNNQVCDVNSIALLELERPHQSGINDFAVQMIAPPIATYQNNIAWLGSTQPSCPANSPNHAIRPMDRVNWKTNVFHSGQFDPTQTNISVAFGNDAFGSCNTGLNRASNHAQYSGFIPVDAKFGGWTPANFIQPSSQPYDNTNFYCNDISCTGAATPPPYPMSLYPLVFNALDANANMTRRTQIDANSFPTTIGPGDSGTAPIAPTVTTTAASSITTTTASAGGNVTSDGGASVTSRGTCYSTSANPTTPCTSDGTGTGSFTSSLTGLTASTLYHIRAFATNSVGTSYGSDLTFTTAAADVAPTVTTTAASSITTTTASAGGNVTSDGGAAVTSRGTCYSTSANPTTPCTSNGTGTGSFTSSLTGLTPGTLYHIRAFATNSVGTSYGSDLTFTTTALAAPTVTTTAASSIGTTTAQAGGNVTSDGGATVTSRGTCYSTSSNPTTPCTSDGTGTGSFISALSGLSTGTLYHIRAFATNSVGTSYGSDLTFTTGTPATPTVILNGTIQIKGNIIIAK